jgi:site-specific recombinase XerD
MSLLAPTLQAFFIERLGRQRQASPHTVAAYRDTLRLLLGYAQMQLGIQPSQLAFSDVDATRIAGFLDHLEARRGNGARTRNARLAAIHSLFRFAALRHPEHAALIARVLAIPPKRSDRALLTFLTPTEIDVLLKSPDRSTWTGRRDHALLLVAIQTGLRASELTGLTCGDAHLGTGAHLSCHGKGRKHRTTPLLPATAAVLRVWLAERAGQPTDPLFPTRQGRRLSRDALEHRLSHHVRNAARSCPAIGTKKITPHVLRHTAAMQLLRAGVDTSVIALWLGHERIDTTQIYLHADLTIKERALARTTPPNTQPGRYQPPDALLAFLQSL